MYYKRITLYFGLLALLLISCVAKHKVVERAQETKTEQKDSLNARTDIDFSKFQSQLDFNQTNYLKDVLSALNVGYNGQSKDDKLEVEVNRTDTGTKMTVSGTGTANYQQQNKEQLSELRQLLIQRQDSLHQVELAAINKVKSELASKVLVSNKKVTKRGFSTGFYIIGGLIVLLLIAIKTGFKWPFKAT